MPGRPGTLIVNLCGQPRHSQHPNLTAPPPLRTAAVVVIAAVLELRELMFARRWGRVQRLRFRSQQLSLSSLNFNGKAKFFMLSSSSPSPSWLWSRRPMRTSWQPSFWRLRLNLFLLLLPMLLWLIPSTCSAGETKRFS